MRQGWLALLKVQASTGGTRQANAVSITQQNESPLPAAAGASVVNCQQRAYAHRRLPGPARASAWVRGVAGPEWRVCLGGGGRAGADTPPLSCLARAPPPIAWRP